VSKIPPNVTAASAESGEELGATNWGRTEESTVSDDEKTREEKVEWIESKVRIIVQAIPRTNWANCGGVDNPIRGTPDFRGGYTGRGVYIHSLIAIHNKSQLPSSASRSIF
jgi:hypothetical protein